jgi:DNA-binding MarR family transcriptional regulator
MSAQKEKQFFLNNLPREAALRGMASFCTATRTERSIAVVSAYHTLLETSGQLLNHLNAVMSGHGLTQARFRTLFLTYMADAQKGDGKCALCVDGAGRGEPAASGGISPCDLAETMRVERATVTTLIDGLERDGFVRREPAPGDRRSIRIRLTPKGRRLIDEFAPKRVEYMLKLMDNFSTEECKTLVKILEKMERRLAETGPKDL